MQSNKSIQQALANEENVWHSLENMSEHSLSNVTLLRPESTAQPAIYLSGREPCQPRNHHYEMNRVAKTLDRLRVDHILNTTVDSPSLKHHRALYDELEIDYKEILIEDSTAPLPVGHFDRVMEWYYGRVKPKRDRGILVHCSAGINRSALTAGTILWATTFPRPWSTPEEMIAHMRSRQDKDRGCMLLANRTFEQELINWCRKWQGRTFTLNQSRNY